MWWGIRRYLTSGEDEAVLAEGVPFSWGFDGSVTIPSQPSRTSPGGPRDTQRAFTRWLLGEVRMHSRTFPRTEADRRIVGSTKRRLVAVTIL